MNDQIIQHVDLKSKWCISYNNSAIHMLVNFINDFIHFNRYLFPDNNFYEIIFYNHKPFWKVTGKNVSM